LSEHQHEPIRGLPECLPAGERILWQGAPLAASLCRRAFHLDKLVIYFLLLLVWRAAVIINDGSSSRDAVVSILWLSAMALAAIGLLGGFAVLISRTTVYTITSQRLVMRFGIALPVTMNLPFCVLDAADLRIHADGSGDIVISAAHGKRLSYLFLWPHVRPWRFGRVQPMLRSVPNVAMVAQILGRALAAAAESPALPAPDIRGAPAPQSAALARAAAAV
jgi:Bacterial PH domain